VSDPIVGIDLGTTNTVIAACDEGGHPRVLPDDNGYKIHPSVVSFHPNGSVVVGAEAKQRKVIDPTNTVFSVKRLIGRSFTSREIQAAQGRMPYQIKEGVGGQAVVVTRGGEFAVPEISAIVLDHVRNLARKALGHDVTRAVITVPASFNDAQRSATATAGAIAGLTVVRVLNEPTAAALAYGHEKQLSRTIAVYDFGGGTFDVTILRLDGQIYEVLGTAGDSFLGGDDLDERLVDHMVNEFLATNRVDLRQNELSMMRLRAVAEQVKIELSRRTRAIVKIDEIAYGPGGAPIDLQLDITRDQLVSRVADVIERTFPVCEEALKVAALGVGDIEDVVLVGGTTKIPHVRDRVTRFFGKTPRTDVNPEEVVAAGAALQAAALERVLSGKRQTAKTAAPPPGTPMARRTASTPPPIPTGGPRTTAPRFAPLPRDSQPTLVDPTTEEPTGIRKRTTAPMGTPVTPPARPTTERPVARGAAIDIFDGGGTGAGTSPGATPLGRITRPGSAPAPTPPPVPTSSPAARTMFGVPAAPAGTRPGTADPTRPAPDPQAGALDFDDLTTGAQTQRPDFDLPPTSPNFDLPPTSPAPAGAGPVAMPSARTVIMPGGAGPAPPPPAAAQMATMIAATAAATPPRPPIVPVVLDVTPASFGIATVAGYCEELIRRNARVPTEMKRVFVTSRDRQQTVRIRVCQGESRRIDENVVLGDLVLDNLEARPRGETSIEVTFSIDASGILQVRARDARTGQEQRANLEVLGRQSPEELAAARGRLQQLRR
jgi:molecular chaperone DnaK